jgi:hypothetical protein
MTSMHKTEHVLINYTRGAKEKEGAKRRYRVEGAMLPNMFDPVRGRVWVLSFRRGPSCPCDTAAVRRILKYALRACGMIVVDHRLLESSPDVPPTPANAPDTAESPAAGIGRGRGASETAPIVARKVPHYKKARMKNGKARKKTTRHRTSPKTQAGGIP